MNNKNTEILDSLWKGYGAVKDYDVHYSSMRTAISLSFLTVAVTLGGFFIYQTSYYLAFVMPSFALVIAIFLNNFFIQLMRFCLKRAGDIEQEISSIITKTEPHLDKIKILLLFRQEIGEKIRNFKFFYISVNTLKDPAIVAFIAIIFGNWLIVCFFSRSLMIVLLGLLMITAYVIYRYKKQKTKSNTKPVSA